MSLNKKKGVTLIEMMVCIVILSLILSVIGLIVTSYFDVYEEGIRTDIASSQSQPYLVQVVNDLKNYSVEDGTEDEPITFRVTNKLVNSDEKGFDIEVVEGPSSKESLGVTSYRYYIEKDELTRNGVRISRRDKNFSVTDVGIRVFKVENPDQPSFDYGDDFLELKDGETKKSIDIATIVDGETTFNYYFEPYISFDRGSELKTGYTMRTMKKKESSGGGEEGEKVEEWRPDYPPTEKELDREGITVDPSLPSGNFIAVTLLLHTGHDVNSVTYTESGKPPIDLSEDGEVGIHKMFVYEGEVGEIKGPFIINVDLRNPNKNQVVKILVEIYRR